MPIILVASQQPRAGRSTIAAALAYRLARAGRRATLARLGGDESAQHDATAFAALDPPLAASAPIAEGDLASLAASGDLVVEAPAGPVGDLAASSGARVIVVSTGAPIPIDAPGGSIIGAIVTGAAASEAPSLRAREGVIAVLPEDRALAAPSARDIAHALKARWLVEGDAHGAIERVMIGTVASDAASSYFAARERKCVVTRYDKTDIQLAALLTDLELLVLTGGGEPSPYLLDRVSSQRNGVSVLLAEEGTVEAMRAIEGLYGSSRFEGQVKLERAVALLDEAGVPIAL